MPAASQIAGAKRRAAVALEIAKGLALSNDRRFWQVKLTIAGAVGGDAPLDLFASDNPEGIEDVVGRRAAMAARVRFANLNRYARSRSTRRTICLRSSSRRTRA
jgi:hypothetical protein